jgi:hypothetical protein
LKERVFENKLMSEWEGEREREKERERERERERDLRFWSIAFRIDFTPTLSRIT